MTEIIVAAVQRDERKSPAKNEMWQKVWVQTDKGIKNEWKNSPFINFNGALASAKVEFAAVQHRWLHIPGGLLYLESEQWTSAAFMFVLFSFHFIESDSRDRQETGGERRRRCANKAPSDINPGMLQLYASVS